MEKKKNVFDSVKTRLVIIVLLIMAIPLISSVLISYIMSHREAITNMETMNTAEVKLVEHDFKSIVEQNMQVMQVIACSMTTRDLLEGRADADEVSAWLKRCDDNVGDGNTLAIVNADGMQIAKASGDPIDVSDREYFTTVKSTGKFYVSNQNISRTTGNRICTFMYPVFDNDGNFIGAVQRNYNLTELTKMVQDEVQAKNQDIFIGDNNGDLMGHTTMDLEGGEPVNFSTQKWFTESRSSDEAFGSYDSTFNGGNWRMSYQREPITGWVTVIASDKDVALASANKMLTIIVVLGVVLLVAAGVVSVLLAQSFTKPILAINGAVSKLADGEFEEIKEYTGRKDEFGDIVRNTNNLTTKLGDIVKNIQEASRTVSEKSVDLAKTSEHISATADDVSNAVEDIAKGATEQADTVERSTENLNILSAAIQNVSENAQQVAAGAADMNDASQSSAEALRELSASMEKMEESVAEVGESMKATNEAVQSVNEKVDGITSIATQTNLLALNASIEAARAGEAGRGFAIVAEEIGKLATESADTANKIRSEMQNLLRHSEEASSKTEDIADIGKGVNNVLKQTVDKINVLIGGVDKTTDGVSNISGLAEECDASKTEIVDAMSSLSAISEENAASTQETAASMEELNATVNLLAESADSLNKVANQLDQDLRFFKI
jgi:methyl-accepting chemotaxis protein